MSDKTKELIMKTLIVITCIMGSIWFITIIFLPWFFPDLDYDLLYQVLCILAMIPGGLFVILQFVLGGIKPPKVKADKVESQFEDFDQLLKYLRNTLLKRKYVESTEKKTSNSGEVVVFSKEQKIKRTLECFTIIRVPELSDELVDETNDKITEILTENYGKKIFGYFGYNVDMITMFCVDHITPSFKKIVNSNLEQGIKNGRMVAGVVFDEKNIYIAKQKDGFAIAKYKKLRKEFMNVMNLKKKNK